MSVFGLWLALALDLLLGDPRRLHPVSGIGILLRQGERLLQWPPHMHRMAGAVTIAGVATVVGIATFLLERAVALLPSMAESIATALLLVCAFSVRALRDAARQVEDALLATDLPGARRLLGTHLVSRDTASLQPEEIRQATISSIAENFTDSVVAPIFYFALFGLPGAWVYRVVNTADAMFGYKNERYRLFGWAPARLDDLLNWLPARLAAALLWLSGHGPRPRGAFLRREAEKTPSPNGGWTMGTMALLLGVRLEKSGSYILNESGILPDATAMQHALQIFMRGSVLAFAVGSIVVWSL